MTYKKDVPQYVLDRWLNLNPNYKIEFSLDDDCIKFLQEKFNDNMCNLFKNIKKGMYKADLWRLCRLYKHNETNHEDNNKLGLGVYSDVDIVPKVSIDRIIPYENTLYTCLSLIPFSIFQAFMIKNLSKNHCIFLVFIISFYVKEIHKKYNGGTYDMYNCFSYIFNKRFLLSNKLYTTDKIKLKIKIGKSDKNIKYIDLGYFDYKDDYEIVLHKKRYNDILEFKIENHILIVKNINNNNGWNYNYYCDIIFNQSLNLFLYKENGFFLGCNQYVSYQNNKILNSRDHNYFINNGY